jgi:riboflavin kinase/FMN adenylyltransferase
MTTVVTGDPLLWDLDVAGSAVAIGVFDGVHLGHRAVMTAIAEEAHQASFVTIALTFDPHPLEFLESEVSPELLTTVDRRADLLGDCGVDVVGVLPFPHIRDLDPRVFATEILAIRLRAQVVAVGENFRFGRDRLGDISTLRAVAAERGFEVRVVDLVGSTDGEVVSSSRIRTMVAVGDVAGAARLLGRSFELEGPVIHGDARGRSIGFPTANIHIPDRMAVPANGVYAAWALVDGASHPAVVNIGVRPTFGLDHRTVEAHLIGVETDIYGEIMALAFVDRIRDERKFASVDDLVSQIRLDRDRAAAILAATSD